MKYLGLLFLFTFSIVNHAAETTPEAVPSNLHIYSGGGAAYVDMVAAGCSGSRYYLSPDHVKYDSIFSILLAAQLSKREVVLRFDGCVNGSNARGNIVGVYLR